MCDVGAQYPLLFCRAKEEPIMCHFRPKDSFAGERVFCLQSVRGLRIIFRFDIIMHEEIQSENSFFCTGWTAGGGRAFLLDCFGGGSCI